MAKWIQKADIKKGDLHKVLGIPAGHDIPPSVLAQALKSDDEHLRKMAQFAVNAKHFKKK